MKYFLGRLSVFAAALTTMPLFENLYAQVTDTAATAATAPAPTNNSGDTAWMLVSAALVLLMTPGLAFFYAGMVRSKNAVTTAFQSFVAIPLITIVWFVVGYSL